METNTMSRISCLDICSDVRTLSGGQVVGYLGGRKKERRGNMQGCIAWRRIKHIFCCIWSRSDWLLWSYCTIETLWYHNLHIVLWPYGTIRLPPSTIPYGYRMPYGYHRVWYHITILCQPSHISCMEYNLVLDTNYQHCFGGCAQKSCHGVRPVAAACSFQHWSTEIIRYTWGSVPPSLFGSEVSARLSSLAIRLRGTLLPSWSLPRYFDVYIYDIHIYINIWFYTHNLSRNKTDTYLLTTWHIHTGMRVTKVKVKHMEDRLYIHRNRCVQNMNAKTLLDHLTSLNRLWRALTLTS